MLKQTFLRTLVVLAVSAAVNLRAQDKPAAPAAPAPAPSPAPAESKPLTGKVKVTIDTSKGAIELELDADKAPISVNNFVNYVKKGHYDGTIFHRVIAGFMIQGGGFTENMEQKPTEGPIPNEAKNGLKNDRGTIAMARTSDPNSATAQFFINVVDNGGLNFPSPDGNGYAVFGKVTKGMDICDAIAKVATNGRDTPKEPVVIKKVTVGQ
jgi:cyclophilin family peptidyl-prolyl cis-trans isomerase